MFEQCLNNRYLNSNATPGGNCNFRQAWLLTRNVLPSAMRPGFEPLCMLHKFNTKRALSFVLHVCCYNRTVGINLYWQKIVHFEKTGIVTFFEIESSLPALQSKTALQGSDSTSILQRQAVVSDFSLFSGWFAV